MLAIALLIKIVLMRFSYGQIHGVKAKSKQQAVLKHRVANDCKPFAVLQGGLFIFIFLHCSHRSWKLVILFENG